MSTPASRRAAATSSLLYGPRPAGTTVANRWLSRSANDRGASAMRAPPGRYWCRAVWPNSATPVDRPHGGTAMLPLYDVTGVNVATVAEPHRLTEEPGRGPVDGSARPYGGWRPAPTGEGAGRATTTPHQRDFRYP